MSIITSNNCILISNSNQIFKFKDYSNKLKQFKTKKMLLEQCNKDYMTKKSNSKGTWKKMEN